MFNFPLQYIAGDSYKLFWGACLLLGKTVISCWKPALGLAAQEAELGTSF